MLEQGEILTLNDNKVYSVAKGKITDMLAQEADIIVRFQGGANAGHTIVNDYGKFALHTLPSGVFYDAGSLPPVIFPTGGWLLPGCPS